MTYIPLKAIKGKALENFLANYPLLTKSYLNDELIINLKGSTCSH